MLLTCIQLLSITCNNASPNDTMITELADLIQNFPGDASRTQCFAHIINLIAKSLLKQFDVPKKKAGEALDEAENALCELAEGIDLEEMETRLQARKDGNPDGEDGDEFEDAFAGLSSHKQAELSESIRPVRLVLVKVGLLIHLQQHIPDMNLTAS
jgi:hypothetical protein